MSKYFDMKKALKLSNKKVNILIGGGRLPRELEAGYVYMINNLENQIADKDKEIEELKYKITLLEQALEMVMRDKSNPLSPYKWCCDLKEVSNETNNKIEE